MQQNVRSCYILRRRKKIVDQRESGWIRMKEYISLWGLCLFLWITLICLIVRFVKYWIITSGIQNLLIAFFIPFVVSVILFVLFLVAVWVSSILIAPIVRWISATYNKIKHYWEEFWTLTNDDIEVEEYSQERSH